MRKPPNLAFGLDERPPAGVTLLSGLQHVAAISGFLVYPLIVLHSAGLDTGVVANLLSIGFLCLGIATLLQALPRGPVGSGYLCPATFTAAFIGPSLAALKLGGLPLLFGMTLFSGVVQSALSRALHLLRPFLPTELSGLVVLLVGITAGVAGARYMVGGAGDAPASGVEWAMAAGTLGLMAGLSIWASGLLRMLCVLAAMLAGYAGAALAGLVGEAQLHALDAAPAVALPSFSHIGWAFDLALVIPFAVAAIATTLKAVGSITLAQRVNDADWVRPDMVSNRKGVLADGLGIALAGLLGAFGSNTSSANVALSSAAGVTSRRVAFAVAGIFVLLAFLPKIATLLAVMPRSIMAATLLFATCFLLVNGIQIIASRMLDTRKTLVIGLATVAGVAVEVFPGLASLAPAAMAPLLGTSLVFGTVVALVLNLLFRIGVRQTVRLSLDPSALSPAAIEDFYKRHGASWGARPDVVQRATFGTLQLAETVAENCAPKGPLELAVSFDEYNLEARLRYSGELLEFPLQRPSNEEIRQGDGMRRLAGFMLRRNADRVQASASGAGVEVHFHFDH